MYLQVLSLNLFFMYTVMYTIKQGQPCLTPPGSYLVLRYCNCSCTDLRGAVLKKWEVRQRADYTEARGKVPRETSIT